MLAWWFVSFKIHWWYGCWGIHCSCTLRKASEGWSLPSLAHRAIFGFLFIWYVSLASPDKLALVYNSIWFLSLLVQLSTAGGRIIICSDGVWDALSAETALDCSRGMSPEVAAPHIVKVCLDTSIVFLFRWIMFSWLGFMFGVTLHHDFYTI